MRLGPALLESAYERCLCHEFDHNALPYQRQVDLRAVQRSFLARMGRVSLKCHTPMGTAL